MPKSAMNQRLDTFVAIRDVTIDLENGLVTKGGEAVAVRCKVYELLTFLASNPNRVISKDELVQALWQGAAVTDDAVTQTIGHARKCIGDTKREIIRTIYKRGFLFSDLSSPIVKTRSAERPTIP